MLGCMGKDLQPPSPRAPHLIVRVGERHYGLPAERIRRVVASMNLWPVAGYAPALIGLGRFGGEPLAVLSLENLTTGLRSRWSGSGTVIVVWVGHGDDLGFVVDEALDVRTVELGSGESTRGGLLKKTVIDDGRVVSCVDFGVFEARKESIDES